EMFGPAKFGVPNRLLGIDSIVPEIILSQVLDCDLLHFWANECASADLTKPPLEQLAGLVLVLRVRTLPERLAIQAVLDPPDARVRALIDTPLWPSCAHSVPPLFVFRLLCVC